MIQLKEALIGKHNIDNASARMPNIPIESVCVLAIATSEFKYDLEKKYSCERFKWGVQEVLFVPKKRIYDVLHAVDEYTNRHTGSKWWMGYIKAKSVEEAKVMLEVNGLNPLTFITKICGTADIV